MKSISTYSDETAKALGNRAAILLFLLLVPAAAVFLVFEDFSRFDSVAKSVEQQVIQSLKNGDVFQINRIGASLQKSNARLIDVKIADAQGEILSESQPIPRASDATLISLRREVADTDGTRLGFMELRVMFPFWLLFGVVFLVGFISFLIRLLVLRNLRNLANHIIGPIQEMPRMLNSGVIRGAAYSELEVVLKEIRSARRQEEIAREAHKKNEERDAIINLATQVAHDIRSPLSVISLGVSSLPDDSAEIKSLLESASKRIKGIADDLLKMKKSFGHVETTNASSMAKFSLNKSVATIIAEKQTEFGNRYPIVFDAGEKDEDAFVVGNEQSVQRMLSNLLNNAAEASRVGSKIEIVIKHLAESIDLEIRDHGCGIPADVLSQIFTSRTTTKSYGNGLGISHAKSLMDGINGVIKIESKVGIGTKITLRFSRSLPAKIIYSEPFLK